MKEPDCRKNVRDIMRKPLRFPLQNSVLDDRAWAHAQKTGYTLPWLSTESTPLE